LGLFELSLIEILLQKKSVYFSKQLFSLQHVLKQFFARCSVAAKGVPTFAVAVQFATLPLLLSSCIYFLLLCHACNWLFAVDAS
jgi:hypothetical protein